MIEKRIKIPFFHAVTIMLICILQLSCGAGSESTTSSSNSLKTISLGSVATIPILPSTMDITTMVVDNNVGSNLKLISGTILNNGKNIDAIKPNDLVEVSGCNNLKANASCAIAISPQELSGSFILKLVFIDNNGTKYSGIQMMNYSSEVKQDNGFVYFAPDQLPLSEGKHTLSVPIILENNYSKLSVTTADFPGSQTSIQCPGGQYTMGTMCTIHITYSPAQDTENLLPLLLLSGKIVVDNDKLQLKTMALNDVIIPLSISNNGAANLVVSAPNINVTAGSNTLVTMLNNGVGTATGISYNGLTPVTATTSGGTCAGSLASGNTCTFNVSVSSTTTSSALGSVMILYSNGVGQTKNLPFNVYYFPVITTPGLTLYTHGWFVGTLVNSINYQGVYIANTGTTTFNNLQFSNIGNQVAAMSYDGAGQTCVSGQSLAPGSGCVLVISYAPSSAVAISAATKVNIVATASYTDLGGNTINYVGDSVSMQYSANAPGTNLGNYVVAGDYGAITANLSAAVITGTSGWTVRNNTPFTASATTISRMVNNGNLQVVGTGGTAPGSGFIYQAPYGMIWEQANSGGVPPTGSTVNAITGLTYDSTNGYLVTNNANTNVYSTTVLNKSSTIWATRAAFATRPAYNLFNFFDGSSWSYFAPQNTATVGQELAVSKTPKTAAWTAVDPSGAARTYIASIYDGSRYCVLSSTKFISCANSAGFTTGSAWTQNATTISAATAASMMANNGSSSYVALGSTAPFVVFLASPANPATAGTWTSAATQPSAALTWVDYGGGQYIAVSAATPGLVWTSPTGNVWTQRTLGAANNPANKPYGFVYHDGSNYWASGTLVLRVSPDGVNWSNAGIQSLTYLYNGTTLTYLAAGTAGGIESSTNLTSWTGVNSTTTKKINHISCFNSNNCFAVGESGTILFSSDGTGATWNSQIAGTSKSLNAVSCGYTNCVIVGESGLILTKPITSTTWTSQIVGSGSNSLNSVTFSNQFNRYIAVGNAGVIYISSDGISWTSKASGTTNNLNSVKCAYSRIGCMAVGNVIATPTSGTVITSLNGLNWTAQTATTGSNQEVDFYNGNWVVAQGTSTVGGSIRSTQDVLPPAWTSAKTSSITNASAINFNAILAY